MAEAAQQLARTEGSALKPEGPLGQVTQLFGERALRQIGLLVGLAAAIALGVGLFVWAKEPVYRPLYGNLAEAEAAKVVEALTAAAVPHKLDPATGRILVPADQVQQTRLQLAGQGLPQSTSIGFESLHKEQGFGTSQFMETARFQRALETELARTVASMQSVESARVHLAIPKPSVFVRDKSAPKASVAVNVASGRSLSDGQVAAIVHMVASSVPDMPHENVTVVDQRGRLLTDKDDTGLGASARQLEYKAQIEDSYTRRIEALLTPLVGAGRVRAQVNARVNFSTEESTQEIFEPGVIRSEQTSEQRTQQDQTQGVPGALTNQPPQAGTLAPGEETVDADAGATQINRSATRNFEVGKTIRHTRKPLGVIERLSVAVLVDDKEVLVTPEPVPADPQAAGAADPAAAAVEAPAPRVERVPLSAEELDKIAVLVKEAVGFDAQRGDSVNVINAAFRPDEAFEPVEVPLTEQPWVLEAGKLGIAALLGLLLILLVLRPLVRGLFGTPAKPKAREAVTAESGAPDGADLLEGPDGVRQLTSPAQQALADQRSQLAQVMNATYQDTLTQARAVVAEEPALAANVVRNWLSENE